MVTYHDLAQTGAQLDTAIGQAHTQGSDTALGALGTKNPPIDADLAIYRDSAAANALVTSTWTQVKAFLKTYFDTLYNNYVHPNHSGDVTSTADGAQLIAADAVEYTETTGSIKALTPVTDSAANFAANFTGANLYGGIFICNSAGTCQLPVMAAGMNFTIITLGAIAVVVDTNAADGYLMDGVTNAEGKNLTNLSTAGDMAVFQYYTADDWLITTNGWTPEA